MFLNPNLFVPAARSFSWVFPMPVRFAIRYSGAVLVVLALAGVLLAPGSITPQTPVLQNAAVSLHPTTGISGDEVVITVTEAQDPGLLSGLDPVILTRVGMLSGEIDINGPEQSLTCSA